MSSRRPARTIATMPTYLNEDVTNDWDEVAPGWARWADVVEAQAAPLTAALLAAAAVQPGDHLFELAAGPGALAPTWSKLTGPTGRVLLTDGSPAMVDVARSKSEGLANVDTATIDITAIDQPDGSFDVVVCRMGLMFAPDPAAALAEIRRVLQPGGRFAALTWAGAEHNPWLTCVGAAAARAGLVPAGSAADIGVIFSLGDPEELAALVTGAGFVDVDVRTVETTMHVERVDDYVDQICALAPPLASALRGVPEDALDALRRAAAELMAPHAGAAGIDLPGLALAVSGRAATPNDRLR